MCSTGEMRDALPSRVLVVDDDADTAWSQAMLLEGSGHDVRIAHDGFEAIEVEREFRPDAIVLDLMMPGLDGFEAARYIRATERSRRVLIIAISGCCQDSDKERARAAGCDYHLTKPADPTTVDELVSRNRHVEETRPGYGTVLEMSAHRHVAG